MVSEKQPSDHQGLLKAQAHIWKHIFSYINSMSLKCAVELAIPDAIRNHGSPMTLPELVAKLPIRPSKAPGIARVMRILTHSGFFALQEVEGGEQGYALTDTSRLLSRDDPFSAAPLVLALVDPRFIEPWQYMSAWFGNDDVTTFETAYGMPLWEYGAREPSFTTRLNEGMASDSRLVASIVTSACKEVFEGVNTLVDVGGGTGAMAKGIAKAFPDLKCMSFDLPHVVEGLEGTENLKFVGGDMFATIPPANAILLKWILHDWSDEDCTKILQQCKKAIVSNNGEGGKVIIIELVMQDQNRDKDSIETQFFLDLQMMGSVNGKERDENEWSTLFTLAGFSSYKITPILGLRSLIEVYP